MRDYDLRTLPVTDGLTDDLKGWLRAVSLGFTQADWPEDAMERWRLQQVDDRGRIVGAYPVEASALLPEHMPVATFGSFAKTLNTGGGHLESTHLISDVTVRATHRRRGLLRELMTRDLADAAAEGHALAALTCTEATIYGRFGFGVATQGQKVELDTRRAALPAPAEPRLELTDAASAAPLLRTSFARFHAATRGSIDRPAFYDDILTGAWDYEKGGPDRGVRVAVHTDAAGEPDGHVCYRINDSHAEVIDLIAADPAVELALWHFLINLDLVDRVDFHRLGPSSPLRWALSDPRALKTVRLSDMIWLRVLNVERALAVRGWDAEGAVEFAVDDDLGHAEGWWRLEVGGGEPAVTRIDREPAVHVSARALGSLYLGGVDARVLAAAGQITGPEDDVAALARLFCAERPPYCATGF